MISFLNLPDLVLVKILHLLMPNVVDVENLSFTNKQLKYFVRDNFASLYYEHLKIDNKTFDAGLKKSKPILSLELGIHTETHTCPKYEINPEFFRPEDNSPILMIIHPKSTSAILQRSIPLLNLKLLRKLTLICENRHAVNLYLDTRDLVFRNINNDVLEELNFSFCFLGRGPTNDDILKRFSTNHVYPSLRKLTLNFFDNGTLEWGDYTTKTLKHHLYGMALSKHISTVTLINLEQSLFNNIRSFLNKLSQVVPADADDAAFENRFRRPAQDNSGFYQLPRAVTYNVKSQETAVDVTINIGTELQ